MKKIVWLASYPKSGNTWVRAFLNCLLKDKTEDGFINDLFAPIVSSRMLYDDFLDIETSDLTNDELEELRPLAMRNYAGELTVAPFFIKVHDAYTYTRNDEPLFPPDISIGAIYIVRNPLDIVSSLAAHLDIKIEKAIRQMADEDAALINSVKSISIQVRQKLTSWSTHVNSWTRQKDIPVLLVRYEDMILDPLQSFKKIVDFTGLPFSDDKVIAAIEKSSFDNLQKQEKQFGFAERFSVANPFFRSGKMGSWKEELSDGQVDKIISDHGAVMRAFGYLDT